MSMLEIGALTLDIVVTLGKLSVDGQFYAPSIMLLFPYSCSMNFFHLMNVQHMFIIHVTANEPYCNMCPTLKIMGEVV